MSLTVSELTPEALPEIRAALLAAKLPPAELTPGWFITGLPPTTGGRSGSAGWKDGGGSPAAVAGRAAGISRRRAGVAMVRALEGFAANAGAKTLHLLTTTAAPFFERLAGNRATA